MYKVWTLHSGVIKIKEINIYLKACLTLLKANYYHREVSNSLDTLGKDR